MYSINSADASGKEDQFGTPAAGKDADPVVLSHNSNGMPARNWTERVFVEMTIANGNIIYQNGV